MTHTTRQPPPAIGWRGAWWGIGALSLAGLAVLPVAVMAVLALTPTENIWPHLMRTVLPVYVKETVLLTAGVGAVTFLVGTATAWLITMCRFPGRRVFQWLLLTPLAMPTYITAYTWVELLEYAGPVQTGLRSLFGWSSPADYRFFEIRSLAGAVLVMSAVLYPYVFITARASFMKQTASPLEVARTLGQTPWGAFFRVALPLARPAIVVGVSLALMECLNDIGAVEHFGVRTLTLGIYTTWLGRGNLAGAAQIALVMFAFVLALLWAERRGRRGQAYHAAGKARAPRRVALTGWRRLAAMATCAIPVLFGFVIPVSVLLSYAVTNFAEAATPAYGEAVFNTLGLSASAALVTVAAGLFLAYARRLVGGAAINAGVRLASVGYAIPGTVLGVGILVPLAATDNLIASLVKSLTGASPGLLLTGSVAAIMFGYMVRFLAIALGNLESGLERITPNLSAAARTLGRTPGETLVEIHLPLLRPALISAALLVFVEGMKELPATLILRPFGFETLSTQVYTLASLDLLEESALAAVTIVAAGILPVIILSRSMRGSKTGRKRAKRATVTT